MITENWNSSNHSFIFSLIKILAYLINTLFTRRKTDCGNYHLRRLKMTHSTYILLVICGWRQLHGLLVAQITNALENLSLITTPLCIGILSIECYFVFSFYDIAHNKNKVEKRRCKKDLITNSNLFSLDTSVTIDFDSRDQA